MKTWDEVRSSGSGILNGKCGVRHEEYESDPRPYSQNLQTTAEDVIHPYGQYALLRYSKEASDISSMTRRLGLIRNGCYRCVGRYDRLQK
jgi:hypothetical protein